MPRIHMIPGLPALLVVARYRDGCVLVLANPDHPWREVFNVSRALLYRRERRELARVLLTH